MAIFNVNSYIVDFIPISRIMLSDEIKAKIVQKILEGKTEEAIEELSEIIGVDAPKIKIKKFKGINKALAVYSVAKKTIFLSKGEYYYNPLIILHEFYHHIRIFRGKHRGTEKNANSFALDFIDSYVRLRIANFQ